MQCAPLPPQFWVELQQLLTHETRALDERITALTVAQDKGAEATAVLTAKLETAASDIVEMHAWRTAHREYTDTKFKTVGKILLKIDEWKSATGTFHQHLLASMKTLQVDQEALRTELAHTKMQCKINHRTIGRLQMRMRSASSF